MGGPGAAPAAGTKTAHTLVLGHGHLTLNELLLNPVQNAQHLTVFCHGEHIKERYSF
jgi:hypothetical protein